MIRAVPDWPIVHRPLPLDSCDASVLFVAVRTSNPFGVPSESFLALTSPVFSRVPFASRLGAVSSGRIVSNRSACTSGRRLPGPEFVVVRARKVSRFNGNEWAFPGCKMLARSSARPGETRVNNEKFSKNPITDRLISGSGPIVTACKWSPVPNHLARRAQTPA